MSAGNDRAPSARPPRGDRLIALFLAAAVAFSPPLLRIFGAGDTLFGWPLLYVYLLAAWAGVIALAALAVEHGGER